jgi:hypothetical protein
MLERQHHPQTQQLTPEQQQEQQLAAKDLELAYNARFGSNIAYARPPDPQPGQEITAAAGLHQQPVMVPQILTAV